MDISELEAKIKEIRDRPLLVVCVLPTGRICTATVRECMERRGRFLNVVADELDTLLGAELGGDNEK